MGSIGLDFPPLTSKCFPGRKFSPFVFIEAQYHLQTGQLLDTAPFAPLFITTMIPHSVHLRKSTAECLLIS